MIGDFVTARTLARERRQGVIIEKNADGTFVVLGESGQRYTCRGKVIPIQHASFPKTQKWIDEVRKSLGL
jgi:hypothetical protein